VEFAVMSSNRLGKHDLPRGLSKTLTAVAALGVLLLALNSQSLWQPTTSKSVRLIRLSGTVVADEGLVSGAVVRVKGHSTSTLTSSQGRFTLDATLDAQRITAWKEGYFIGGAAADSQPLQVHLKALPQEDNPDYVWGDPTPNAEQEQNCGNCHEKIYQEWAAGAHASAASNRRFLNLYDGTNWNGHEQVGWNLMADNANAAGVCTACHAPSVNVEDAAFDDLRKAAGVSAMGVHCDYCHKIQAPEPVPLGITHGRFGLKLLRPNKGQQLFFGPLDDVDRGEDAYSSFYHESRYCASCHEGTMFGVHVYSTYSEWLKSPASRAGKECQTCHMRPSEGQLNIAPGHGGIARDPRSLSSHHFPGGSIEMLKNCLTIRADIIRLDGRVNVNVEVKAHDVGHRVPTGFVDRHLLLLVSADDEAGRSVPLTAGPVVPKIAGAELAGHAGRVFAKQLSDFEGNSPVPFWLAKPEYVDTRLDPNRPDRSAFVFGTSVQWLRIRLIYRRFWQEVADTKSWPDNEIIVFDRTVQVGPHPEKKTIFLGAAP